VQISHAPDERLKTTIQASLCEHFYGNFASRFPENITEKRRGLKNFERATMTRIGRCQIKPNTLVGNAS